jgi:type I restriction enzyme M protein
MNIAWLWDEDENGTEELPEPAALAQEAMSELEAEIAELQGSLGELGEEVVVGKRQKQPTA